MQTIGNTTPRRVLVGTPTYGFHLDSRYVHALTETIRLCAARGIVVKEIFMEGGAIIQSARNDLVKMALHNNFDDLFFIDPDQSWQPEWFLRLLNHPVECVGSAVRKKSEEELYNVKAKGGANSFMRDEETGLLTAPDMALGTGFIRFSRVALQTLWENSEKYGGGKTAWIFDIRPIDGELVGEDIMVSEKLRQNGIQTWLDPTMTCDHHGMKTYSGNFAAWLNKKALEERQVHAA